MAKLPTPIQPLAGLNELQFIFELLRDPASLEQLTADIEARRTAANDTIELIGPAREIEAMNARARANEIASETALKGAQAKAEQIVADATAKAEEIVATAETLEAGVKLAQGAAEAAKRGAEEARRRADAETAGVREREKQVEAKFAEAARIVEQAEAAKADFEGRAAKLSETLKSLGG
ncbi:MAG: hypothetical protein WA210_14345 [Burkholderiaceae bacterium]